jgi:uncharacterized protein YyaL (SSP411 family)
MSRFKHTRFFCAGLALVGLVLSLSCGRKDTEEARSNDQLRGDVSTFPNDNQVKGLPGPVYASQKNSRIHWQPWSKASLEMARESKRLVLAVIAMPQQPSYVEILNDLTSDATVVASINRNYIPILIDGDAMRELGLLAVGLCGESGNTLQFPFMMWMTYEGNPVGWLPLPLPREASAFELFSRSQTMVSRIWLDDPRYVMKNSRLDQMNRSERILASMNASKLSKEPAADGLRALRQLTSLYDPVSRTFDETGGLFPVGTLNLLAMGAGMEGLPADLRQKCKTVLDYLLDDLLVSPMFDPLDGGIFNSRVGTTWDFPDFSRDCASQARIIVSLLNSYEVIGDERALQRALGALEYLERNCGTNDGLFSFDAGITGRVDHWLWRYEEVSQILNAEELAVWMPASGMIVSGNLPAEDDPEREFFRANTISFAKSAEEIAKVQSLDLELVESRLESAKAKLLSARENRMAADNGGVEPNAVASLRMVSAYASAYRITGENTYRDLAVKTLEKVKSHFADGPRLNLYAGGPAESVVSARAFVYGAAIQAALDVDAVTLDGTWQVWAGDLSSTVFELFSADGYVKECPPSADLMGLPIADSIMLYEDSTAGLLSMSESRLASLGIPLVPSLRKKLSILPAAAITDPVIYTDMIQSVLMREHGVTYVFGKDAPQALKDALARSPLNGVTRRAAYPNDSADRSPKPDEALRITPDGKTSPIKAAEEIRVPSLP